ncbi:hypothetical protein LCGC14_0935780 [marine sediment metagenome]|uniref:Tetratricopeptide repeat protein n=1 Tax=marine sediment metagenome TaxID=412755 RepID=A0A0F9R559_9ZZZZ
MSEKQISSLMKKGEKLYKKTRVLEALEKFNNVLKISPEFLDALRMKTQILSKLGRPEEFFQASSQLNLLKLKKEGEIPSNINSPDIWIEEAIKLMNDGQNERALMCIIQASYISPIVNKEGLTSMTHHTNAKIYYYTAIILFNKRENYNLAMKLFEIAGKLDPNCTIPDKIKDIYNNYLSNRSGEGVKMIVPLNTTNLRDLFPSRDTLLLSTEATAKADQLFKGQNKYIEHKWKTHMLLSDYGMAFICITPICESVVGHYIPWPFVAYSKKNGFFIIGPDAGDFVHISFWCIHNPQAKSKKEHIFKYLYDLNIDLLKKEREEDLIKKTMIKLKSLGYKPSFKEYKKRFENIPKLIFQRSIRRNKRSKK